MSQDYLIECNEASGVPPALSNDLVVELGAQAPTPRRATRRGDITHTTKVFQCSPSVNMSFLRHPHDRLLGLTLLATFLAASRVVPSYLNHIKSLAESPSDPQDGQNARRKLEDNAEDALQPSTLLALYNGPSPEIQASVIKIVASRTLKPENKPALLQSLASSNAQERDRAIKAFHLLLHHPTLMDKNIAVQLLDEDSFASVITALVNLLPLHQHPNPSGDLPPSPLAPIHRPSQERQILPILHTLLAQHSYFPADGESATLHNALSAGLVSKWLVQYPFPCAIRPTPRFRKSSITAMFSNKRWGSDDPAMAAIFSVLMGSGQALGQLREAGLRAPYDTTRYVDGDDPPVEDDEGQDLDDEVQDPTHGSWEEWRRQGSTHYGWDEGPFHSHQENHDDDPERAEYMAQRRRQRIALAEEVVARHRHELGHVDLPPAAAIAAANLHPTIRHTGTSGTSAGPGVDVDDRDDDNDVRMRGGEDTAGLTARPLRRTPRRRTTTITSRDTRLGEASSSTAATAAAEQSSTTLSTLLGTGPEGGINLPQPREHPERSVEEENLRRRHREAVVVADHGVPLRRENILQRRSDT